MRNRNKYILATVALILSLTLIVGATSNLPANAQEIVTGEISLDDEGFERRGDRGLFDNRDQNRDRPRLRRPRR